MNLFSNLNFPYQYRNFKELEIYKKKSLLSNYTDLLESCDFNTRYHSYPMAQIKTKEMLQSSTYVGCH